MATRKTPNEERVTDLLYQALETELGGIEIYEKALECVQDDDLREEWEEYLEQTRKHAEVVQEVLEAFELDPDEETPGRTVVRHVGEQLVEAMRMALEVGPEAAELVATECVTMAETKDHQNWSLLSEVARKLEGERKKRLGAACKAVEGEEDEHLYHSAGWSRELWLQALGLDARIPPPEEEEDVKSEEEAAAAKKKAKRKRARAG